MMTTTSSLMQRPRRFLHFVRRRTTTVMIILLLSLVGTTSATKEARTRTRNLRGGKKRSTMMMMMKQQGSSGKKGGKKDDKDRKNNDDDDKDDGSVDTNTYVSIPIDMSTNSDYASTRDFYLQSCADQHRFYNTICKVWRGDVTRYDTSAIEETLTFINQRHDAADFRMTALMRILYMDEQHASSVLPIKLKRQMKETVLGFKYWFDEPGDNTMIHWTENHAIMFHTAELLAGQLYPDEIFTNSNRTGSDLVRHVLPLVEQWLLFRGRFGFTEWHSNVYASLTVAALSNLVEYSQEDSIAIRAAILIDEIGFEMANNYFKGLYATTMGRTEDRRRVPQSNGRIASESSTDVAYLLLGLEELQRIGNDALGGLCLATSQKYIPPVILAEVAVAARDYHEHMERNSIDIDQGDEYGISYDSEESVNDIVSWWTMSGPAAGQVIDSTGALIVEYNLDANLVVMDATFLVLLNQLAAAFGLPLSVFCKVVAFYIVRGIVLESSNTYTYRTPYYQLSGAQDHQKGLDGFQEQIWQATLDLTAYVFTNAPSVLSREFMGGWKPRGTFYKNVGILQYNRDPGNPVLDNTLAQFLGTKNYVHAYFPRSAFDQVVEKGQWLFGSKSGGFVALYSQKGGVWVSDYEWRVSDTLKNLYIVELGSVEENGSFYDFMANIASAEIVVTEQERGYNVAYHSPSSGQIIVSWDGPMMVANQEVDIGPYPRFGNDFCNKTFASLEEETVITHNNLRLILDFEAPSRTLQCRAEEGCSPSI